MNDETQLPAPTKVSFALLRLDVLKALARCEAVQLQVNTVSSNADQNMATLGATIDDLLRRVRMLEQRLADYRAAHIWADEVILGQGKPVRQYSAGPETPPKFEVPPNVVVDTPQDVKRQSVSSAPSTRDWYTGRFLSMVGDPAEDEGSKGCSTGNHDLKGTSDDKAMPISERHAQKAGASVNAVHDWDCEKNLRIESAFDAMTFESKVQTLRRLMNRLRLP